MTIKRLIVSVVCLLVSLNASTLLEEVHAEPYFVTIGSSEYDGIYFPAGLAIAKIINDKRDEYDIRAVVEATPGSVFNINAISSGYMDFGLAQSDKQYQAVNGLEEWSEKGPQNELRSVFSLHQESVNLLVAADTGIATVDDLKGARVNLGDPISGHYLNSFNALKAYGLDPEEDVFAVTVPSLKAVQMLQYKQIDALFCTAGHPSGILLTATSGKRKVRFIPLTGPGIDRLVAARPYYVKMKIPVAKYYETADPLKDVDSFGVTAALLTSVKTPDYVVYSITKEVFENLDEFKKQHPAFADISKREMLKNLIAPLHPGALQYYKEIGLVGQ